MKDTYSKLPDRVAANFAEHWASIPNVIGEVPDVPCVFFSSPDVDKRLLTRVHKTIKMITLLRNKTPHFFQKFLHVDEMKLYQ